MKNLFLCLCSLMLGFSTPLQAVQTTVLSAVFVKGSPDESDDALKAMQAPQSKEDQRQQEIIEGHKKPCNKCVGICMTAVVGVVLLGAVLVGIWHYHPHLFEAA